MWLITCEPLRSFSLRQVFSPAASLFTDFIDFTVAVYWTMDIVGTFFTAYYSPKGGTRAFSPSDCLALLDAWWFHRAMNCRAKRSHPTLMCKILIDLAGAFRKRWFLLDVLIVGVDWTFMAATIGADSTKVVQLRYFNWFEFILIILDSIFVRVFMIFIYLHAFARGGRWRSAGGECRGIWFGTSWEGDSRRSHFAYLAAPAAHEIEVQSSGLGLAFQVGSSYITCY